MSLDEYNKNLESSIQDLLEKSEQAKKDSPDVEQEVGVGFAEDMAGRCEKLLGIEGLADAIRELEEEGIEREQIAFKIAEKFANGELGDYEDQGQKVEAAIRSSIALLTQGVVAAPIEGLGNVTTDEGYIRIPYNGPIRSAGGTGQALSVLVAEYVRQILEIPEFEATKEEVERYVEEIRLYDGEQSMQYLPSREEIETIIENTPIMLDGDPTTDNEVEGYRNLKRINTNRGRGGMCLVVAEGMALKAPKIQKFVEEFNLEGWDWISELIDEEETEEDEEETEDEENQEVKRRRKPKENWEEDFPKHKKYIKKLPAGRPMFSEPKKGFRLRYGKSRNIGLAAAGINPAAMHILHDFIANSTQLKSERPGKAIGMASVTSIDGPTIKTKNGDIIQVNTQEKAKELVNEDQIERIIDLGEILIGYGEFLENNHDLPPSPYTREWWVQDVKQTEQTPEELEKLEIKEYIKTAKQHSIPLHPQYTPFWTQINHDQLKTLKQNITFENNKAKINKKHSEIIEKLLIPATAKENNLIIKNPHSTILKQSIPKNITNKPILEQISNTIGLEVMQRNTIRIGTRMGRPEQAKKREMDPAVDGLYPIADAGGDTRNIIKASKNPQDSDQNIQNNKNKQQNEKEQLSRGQAKVKTNNRKCPNCQTKTYRIICNNCNTRTKQQYKCNTCEFTTTIKPEDPQCPDCTKGKLQAYQKNTIDINKDYQQAKQNLGLQAQKYSKVKGVKKLMSETRTPEPLEKAILRRKHNVSTFRDGTCRFDIMDLPLTTFKPKEIGITVKQAKNLGYKKDINGNKLTNPNQLLEIYPQDVIIAKDGAKYLHKVANYIDELLQKYYNQKPHYNAETPKDLIGHEILGLAPHTSAALVGRIIGFTDSAANYASPFWHAGKRRNCFHPNTSINTKQNNKWQNQKIKNFVEKHLAENPQQDDHGTKYTNIKHKNIQTESYNPEEQQTVTKQITHVNKHPAPKHLVKLQTQTGKTLKITPDHPVLTYNPQTQQHKEKMAGDIQQEDHIITKKHKHHVENPEEIDILKQLLQNPNIDNHNITIKGLENLKQIFKNHYNTQSYLKKLSQETGINKKNLYNYFDYNSIPADILQKAYENQPTMLEKLPKNIKIGRRKQREEINRIIKLDHNLATLLGYYTAEGWYREQNIGDGSNKGANQVTIAATEQESRNFLLRTFERMGMNPYEENEKKITVSGYNTKELFKTTLDTGYGAENKFIPQIIKESQDKNVKAAYLSGYFSGDGSAKGRWGLRNVTAATVSKKLSKDLSKILEKEFDMNVEIEKRPGQRLKDAFPDFYDEQCSERGKDSFIIKIKDRSKFIDDISFYLTRKERSVTEEEGEIIESTTVETISNVEIVNYEKDYVYSVTTKNGIFAPNKTYNPQCDGDQDSIMLLLDGLLNFSEVFLPDIRGQRSVTGDTSVFVRDGDGFRGVEVGEFVDGLFEENSGSVRSYDSDEEFWEDEFGSGGDGEFEAGSEVGERGRLGDDVGGEVEGGEELENEEVEEEEVEESVEGGGEVEEDVVDEDEEQDELDELLDDVDSALEDIGEGEEGEDEDGGDEMSTDGGFDLGGGEESEEQEEQDGGGPELEVLDVSGLETLSFDGGGSVGFSDVDKVIRHEVGDGERVFEVGFDGGSVSMTGDHGVFVTDGVRVWEEDVCDLEPGDFVLSGDGFGDVDFGVAPDVVDLREVFDDFDDRFEGYFDHLLDVDGEFMRLLGYWFGSGFVVDGCDCGFVEVGGRGEGRAVMDLVGSVFGVDAWMRRLEGGELVVGVPLVFEELFDGVPRIVYGVGDDLVEEFLVGVFGGEFGGGCSVEFGESGLASEVSLLCRMVGFNSSAEEVGDVCWEVCVFEWGESPYWVTPMDREGFEEALEEVPEYVRERVWAGLKNDGSNVLSKEGVEALSELDLDYREEGVGGLDWDRLDGSVVGGSNLELCSEGDLCVERVESVEEVEYDGYVYDFAVPGGENFLCGPHLVFAHNTMDAPLVVTTKMDPEEVDDEVYNVDIAGEYPLEFFEKTQSCPGPKDVDMPIAEDIKESGYGFRNNVETERFDAGPTRSVYATIEGMDGKVDAQMELARLLDDVNEAKVAEIVLGSHLIPDIMGNLSSFTSQEFQCVKCYTKYRRPPLNGICENCGYELNLTLYEGSVKKYLDIVDRIVEKYDVADYTEQRVNFINSRIEGVFDSDLEEQSDLEDFL